MSVSTKEFGIVGAIVGAIIVFMVTLTFVLMVGYRHYSVWSMEMQGKAKLAEATHSRQIQIEQARSEREAAVLRAEAIAIVGKAAKEFPEYRLQEFLGAFAEALREGNINQIMYVPTEANIPITEATRIRQAGAE